MERVPVSSSNIAAIGFDPKTSVLEIQFNSGHIYQYFGVPNAVYDGLMAADSHGQFFHKFIRNIYQYSRIS
ncbi:MAG: hypothetical protein BWY45_03479 [Euryarchaeota archaeon ADurb.Bin294]|nr:MAG: hypothetical protein BWY45_03479 [Euryarchaeota archaeon ADurb.Bin294]